MKQNSLAPFLRDYPTGVINTIGNNLLQTTYDYSEQIPPFLIHDAGEIDAMIIPVYRPITETALVLERHMTLAAKYGIVLVFLCSGKITKKDIASLTKTFPKLTWIAISEPFTIHKNSTSDNYPSRFRDTRDTPQKRNFGLHLANTLQWRTILFTNEDVFISDELFLKLVHLQKKGVVYAACNAKAFPDNSVIIHAAKELDKTMKIDSFISDNLLLINIKKNCLSFFPNIYNEDWFFVIPYILKYNKIHWIASIKQKIYNPFIEKRASNEEFGDIIGEGLLRLTIDIIKEIPNASYETKLTELEKKANLAFWEMEKIKRTAFIQELINTIAKPIVPFSKKQKIKRALKHALSNLDGTTVKEGISALEMTNWVHVWIQDLKKRQQTPEEKTEMPLPIIKALTQLLSSTQFRYHLRKDETNQVGHKKTETFHHAFSKLITIPKNKEQKKGLEATYLISQYLQEENKTILEFDTVLKKIRYDRPTKSITNNKALTTIVIIVQAFENIESVLTAIQRISTWNTQQVPINCILWIIPFKQEDTFQLELYREYLTSQLVIRVTDIQIRFLSTIDNRKNSQDILSCIKEIGHIVGLTYWKHYINPLIHTISITNTDNELFIHETLANLIQGNYTKPKQSLKIILHRLQRGEHNMTLSNQAYASAISFARQKLLIKRSKFLRKFLSPTITHASKQLMHEMRHKKITLMELDNIYQTADVHNLIGFDNLFDTFYVLCIPIQGDTSMKYIQSAYDVALKKIKKMKQPVGKVTEILFIVSGNMTYDELHTFRNTFITNLQETTEIPQGVFLTSLLIPHKKTHTSLSFEDYEIHVRFLHWIENSEINPKITWLIIDTQNNFLFVQNKRLLPVKLFFRKVVSSSRALFS